ncbi:MAG: NAD-dependent protein deacylase, partial [Gordonia polyisoprenivorans]|nr:NAD-dependent protein deacylase [Gordonia polyisoprenivorans]
MSNAAISQAVEAIRSATTITVLTGAGMSAESG